MMFAQILKKTQKELLSELIIELEKKYKNSILATSSYIYAKGNIPIMLVAHIDTVHKDSVKNLFYDKKQDVMWSPEGIGGDDRCGIYAILTIIEKGYLPYILFTTDEEIGGIGAKKFVDEYRFDLGQEIKYMIEIDRRGNNQAVFYNCGNKDFETYILNFGFEKKFGTFSDISILSPAYNIASVNLSAGYYNEHTLQEYIKVKHLCNTINLIINMLADYETADFFDYQEIKYSYNSKFTPCSSIKKEDSNIKKVPDDYEYTNHWQMYDDWSLLTDEEWLKEYGFKKPPTAEEVFDY